MASTGPGGPTPPPGGLLEGSPESVPGLEHHGDFGAAAPTPDHFIPLLYLAGVAAAAGRPAEVLVDGYAYGSLSMASYTVDHGRPPAEETGQGAAPLPDPSVVPADDTNV